MTLNINYLPDYIYTGESEFIDEGNGNWKIRLLTSGEFTFLKKSQNVDIFLVGGGGGGANSWGCSGGGGGYTKTEKNIALSKNTGYSVTIGAGGAGATAGSTDFSSDGGTTYFDIYSAAGGGRSDYYAINGGNGGSGGGGGGSNGPQYQGHGGNGGSDGSDGSYGGTYADDSYSGGTGQHTTTREFGESTGDLYAGGGGGGSANFDSSIGYGGAGGGGNGGTFGYESKPGAGENGKANTGGGGGGAGRGASSSYGNAVGGSGGSGIVIIRNTRNPFPTPPTKYKLLQTIQQFINEWIAPEDGWYQIEVFGASGGGGEGSRHGDSEETKAYSGGGGGSGAYARARIKLNAGEKINFTGTFASDDNSGDNEQIIAEFESDYKAIYPNNYQTITVVSGKKGGDSKRSTGNGSYQYGAGDGGIGGTATINSSIPNNYYLCNGFNGGDGDSFSSYIDSFQTDWPPLGGDGGIACVSGGNIGGKGEDGDNPTIDNPEPGKSAYIKISKELKEKLYIYKQGNSDFENCTYNFSSNDVFGQGIEVKFNYGSNNSAWLGKLANYRENHRLYFHIDVTNYNKIIIEGYHSTYNSTARDSFGFLTNESISEELIDQQIIQDGGVNFFEFDVSDKYGEIIFAYERESDGSFYMQNMYLLNESVDSILENNSWETISRISKAGKASEYWNIGDTKTINYAGSQYEIQIIGFDHDDVADSTSYGKTKAGITFQLKNCLNNYYIRQDVEVWPESADRTTINALVSNLDTDLQAVIVPVIKTSCSWGLNVDTRNPEVYETYTSVDTLTLLSAYEVCGTNYNYYQIKEGERYAYYTQGNSIYKTVNENEANWWLRTECYVSETALGIGSNASAANVTHCRLDETDNGLAFAFCV